MRENCIKRGRHRRKVYTCISEDSQVYGKRRQFRRGYQNSGHECPGRGKVQGRGLNLYSSPRQLCPSKTGNDGVAP